MTLAMVAVKASAEGWEIEALPYHSSVVSSGADSRTPWIEYVPPVGVITGSLRQRGCAGG